MGKEGKKFHCQRPYLRINRKTLQVYEDCFLSEAESRKLTHNPDIIW